MTTDGDFSGGVIADSKIDPGLSPERSLRLGVSSALFLTETESEDEASCPGSRSCHGLGTGLSFETGGDMSGSGGLSSISSYRRTHCYFHVYPRLLK